MYYFDTAESNKSPVNAYAFLSTVKDDKSSFSRYENEGSDRYRDPEGIIGWTYVKYYLNILANKQIVNIRVTVNDIDRAEDLYGLIVICFKRKMVRKIPQHVQNMIRIPLPSLISYHREIEQLGAYFMFVNIHILLVATSFNIKFRSIVNMQRRGTTKAENGLKTTISAFTAQK